MSRGYQLAYEGELEKHLNKDLDFNSNPTYLVCLVLFRDIFDQIREADSLIDLFERILINYYESKSPI